MRCGMPKRPAMNWDKWVQLTLLCGWREATLALGGVGGVVPDKGGVVVHPGVVVLLYSGNEVPASQCAR